METYRIHPIVMGTKVFDKSIVSCDLTFTFRTVDASGGAVAADSFHGIGAGFSTQDAAKNAIEKLVSAHGDKILASVR